jgi:heavy metal sensor kinase
MTDGRAASLSAWSQRLPLRVRLTVWYSLCFAVAFFCVGSGCLWMVHRAILDLENNELQQRVRSVRRFLEARPANEEIAQTQAAITATYNVSHGSKWLQVIDEHGRWLYRSPHVTAAYPALTLPQELRSASDYFNYTSAGIHVRALIAPIEVHGRRYTVQTGLSLTKTMVILSNVNTQLISLTALGLIGSSLAGYFMSRKALVPIAAIAAEAKRINDRNLNSRLPELETRDELARLSSTLNQMLGRIEAGYQSVRSFTANAAHELRTPIALLRAETEVALSLPRDTAYYRAAFERIEESSIQMSQLIDQLLMLARTDAGVEVLQMGPLDIFELVHEVESSWRELYAAAGISFRCHCTAAERWIQGDHSSLRRLLNTLLENAWRYTPSGQSVELCVRDAGEGKGRSSGAIELAVRDTGIGIAPQDQVKIFQRFFRAAQPLHGKHPGSGLGLALAQWIAECHGTALTVHSQLGEGSCFALQLTIAARAELEGLQEEETLVALRLS